MNYRLVIAQLGLLFGLLGVIMIATAGSFALVELLGVRADPDGTALIALAGTGGGGALLGWLAWFFGQRNARPFLGRREALLLVAMSWILGAALAAVPFLGWAYLGGAPVDHPFHSPADCYFEAMSGLTTTGASVLTDIEAVPSSLLLWRSLTHWLGGLGIVVLFVAVLPGLGVGGKRIFNVEAPGPSPEGLQPHIRETARWLWYIYLSLSLAQIVALWALTPMDLFDSVCHTFGTMATGGFSTQNASIGAYAHAPIVDAIIIPFMILAGINFNLYYKLVRRRYGEVLRDTELRFYLCLIALGAAVVSLAVWLSPDPIVMTTGEPVESSFGSSLRQGLFTTVSIQTTTGYGTSDFDLWPFAAKSVLVLLMFVGGCAGSTSGGLKVIRVWAMFKILLAEVEHVFRPSVVRPVRFGKSAMDPELKLGTLAFVLGMILLFAAGSGAIMLIEGGLNPQAEISYTTAATSAIATLFTIGPGLEAVGAVENYGWYSAPSKIVLTMLMLLGRLEIFAVIVLFSPRFWRAD